MNLDINNIAILPVFLFCISVESVVYAKSDEPSEYGFIIGNKCGQVIESTFSNDHFSIHVAFPETKTMCGKLNGNTLAGTFEGQSFTMTFEASGLGKGVLHDGTELLMVRGEKNTHTNYEKLLESRGLKNSFNRFMTDQGIALDDAIGIYSDDHDSRISVTLIFDSKDIGISSPFNRKRVHTITYSKGKWRSV